MFRGLIDLATHHLAGQRQVGFQVIRIRDALKISRQQFLFGVANHLAQRPIYLQIATIQVNQGFADRGVFERAAKRARSFPKDRGRGRAYPSAGQSSTRIIVRHGFQCKSVPYQRNDLAIVLHQRYTEVQCVLSKKSFESTKTP